MMRGFSFFLPAPEAYNTRCPRVHHQVVPSPKDLPFCDALFASSSFQSSPSRSDFPLYLLVKSHLRPTLQHFSCSTPFLDVRESIARTLYRQSLNRYLCSHWPRLYP